MRRLLTRKIHEKPLKRYLIEGKQIVGFHKKTIKSFQGEQIKFVFTNQKKEVIASHDIEIKDTMGEILRTRTLKDYRKKGLGTTLLRFALKEMKGKGVEYVETMFLPLPGSEKEAKKVIESHDFKPTEKMMFFPEGARNMPYYYIKNLQKTKLKKIELEEAKQ
ncbi:GNAT family N-acetyltransferase [archaeon]|nr:GNAT family N-acetyltransferase [archaeon]